MPTQVTQNTSLSLTLDGTEVNCQLKNVDFTPPGYGAPTVMLTACPDGQVDGARLLQHRQPRRRRLWATPRDEGLTWLLNTAAQSGAEVDYVLTFFDDQGNDGGRHVHRDRDGGAVRLAFARPGTFSHSISLTVLTATVSRPA